MGGEIGRERGDALEEVLCSGTEIEGHRLLRLSAARRGGLVKARHEAGCSESLGIKKMGARFSDPGDP